MKFGEAILLMKQGTKCYQTELEFEHYYTIDEEGNLIGQNGVKQIFNTNMIFNNWEIFDETIRFTLRNEDVLNCRFCGRTHKESNLYETSPKRGIVCEHCKTHLESYFAI